MWQMWQMLQMFIQVHFVAFCDTFWHIQDSRRIRHLRRTSTQNHTLTVIARNACPGTQASSPAKIRLRWLFFFLLFFLLTSCKTPATLTNDTQHHTRDSNYHASIQRIETHDTIILGYYPSAQPKLSNSKLSNCPIVRISDRKITIHDTVFVSRTDTLLRTQTITQKERYIPPFYRFCTISFVTFVSFVTLAFSIHLLLRYLKIRSPT